MMVAVAEQCVYAYTCIDDVNVVVVVVVVVVTVEVGEPYIYMYR